MFKSKSGAAINRVDKHAMKIACSVNYMNSPSSSVVAFLEQLSRSPCQQAVAAFALILFVVTDAVISAFIHTHTPGLVR